MTSTAPNDDYDDHDSNRDDEVVEAEIVDINENLGKSYGASSRWIPPHERAKGSSQPSPVPEPSLASATHPETGRTTDAINTAVEAKAQEISVLERQKGKTKAKVLKARRTEDDAVADANKATLELERAEAADDHARAHPDRYAVRRFGTVLTALTTIAVALFAFGIDRVQLRAVFAFDTIGMVTLIAFVVAAGQAVTAHLAGDAHSDYEFADKSSLVETHWKMSKFVRDITAILGIGSNIALGAIRAFWGAGIVVGALLSAVGVGLWFLAAWVSFHHASPTATAVVRSRRRSKHTRGVATTAVHDREKAEERYRSDRDDVRTAADSAVQIVDNEITHLHRRLGDAGLPPFTPPLGQQYQRWSRIADGTHRDDHDLHAWTPPKFIDPNRRFTPHTDGPRELGPGN